jgi:methyl-accepting chemotaxis protein
MEHGIEQVRSSGERLLQLTNVVANTSKAARDIASTVQVQDGEITQITAVIDELLGAMTVTTEAIHRAESASAGLTETSESVSRMVDQLRV